MLSVRSQHRLYREAQNDYWEARSRRARRMLAFSRLARVVAAVVAVAVVIAGAAYGVHRADPRIDIPGFPATPGDGLPAGGSAADGAAGLPALAPGGSGHAAPGTATASLLATLPEPDGWPGGQEVNSPAFGPGDLLAVGGFNDPSGVNASTYLWNTATGKLAATLNDPDGDTSGSAAVAFGPGGMLAVADAGGETYLWDTASGSVTATLPNPDDAPADAVAFGPDGVLAAGDDEGTTYLWNTATRSLIATLTDPDAASVGGGDASSVAFGPDGLLAVGDRDPNAQVSRTYLWNTTTGKLVATLDDPGGSAQGVMQVAFDSDGDLAAVDANGTLYLWDTATDSVKATFQVPDGGGVTAVASGPDDTLAIGSGKNNTYLWNAATRSVIATLPSPDVTPGMSNGAQAVAFGPDDLLAEVDSFGNTYLWRTPASDS